MPPAPHAIRFSRTNAHSPDTLHLYLDKRMHARYSSYAPMSPVHAPPHPHQHSRQTSTRRSHTAHKLPRTRASSRVHAPPHPHQHSRQTSTRRSHTAHKLARTRFALPHVAAGAGLEPAAHRLRPGIYGCFRERCAPASIRRGTDLPPPIGARWVQARTGLTCSPRHSASSRKPTSQDPDSSFASF